MPRGRPHTDSGTTRTSKKATWKEKLTQDQLERKRAADRQLVRESRHRTRQTIQTLQEQVRLLSEQQSNQVVSDLIQENKRWEEKHELLLGRLYTSPSDGAAVQPPCRVMPEPDVPAAVQDTEPSWVLMEQAQGEPFDLRVEIDARVLIPGSSSPFPVIKAMMTPSLDAPILSEDEFLGSIMLWQQSLKPRLTVYDLACNLLHVDRAPGCMTVSRLKCLSQDSGMLQTIVNMLNMPCVIPMDPIQPLGGQVEILSNLVSGDNDNLVTVRRELIICAFESVRYWTYCSREARVVMFWALYRILSLLVLPTAQNLAKCPAWYRPTLSQMAYDHPSFIDFIPWPHMRENLVQNWPNYVKSNLYSSFVENFDIETSPDSTESLLSFSKTESELVLHPTIDRCLSRIGCLTANEDFLRKSPEFADGIRASSAWSPAISLSSVEDVVDNASLLLPPTLPPQSDSAFVGPGGGSNEALLSGFGDHSYSRAGSISAAFPPLEDATSTGRLSDLLLNMDLSPGFFESSRQLEPTAVPDWFHDGESTYFTSDGVPSSYAPGIDFTGRIFLV
ncbi:hypothetical protein FE257_010713 [Aspergillus nanangensis]|uniref:BZIP domain-containing protein n=1 Tax=Aspergillus nanangensis TaxID=2582783 RepID=A0AAD4CIL3_ASPNN|nr:hypothetical protein FE257_010713 [Aspergillus nanangensis]